SIPITLAITGVPGLSLTGTFHLDINTTKTAAEGLPAGPFFRLDATTANLTILGQTVSTDLAIEQSTDAGGATVVKLGVNNGSISLLGGLVSASGISGLLVMAPNELAGSLTATVALDPSLPVSLVGTFTVAVNTGSHAVSDSLSVGGGTVSLNLPAGPYFQLQATGAKL